MHIYASLSLDDVDDLQLAKHVLQVCLQLFRLPIAELLIRLLVVEGDGLVAFDHLRTISLLHVALHDADDGALPGYIAHG